MALKEALAWRYATKKFDPSKKISQDTLDYILNTVQLAPSSYGLHHYRIIVVEDAAIRQQLKAAAYNQPQVTDASHLIVFAAETNINEEYVKRYVDQVAHIRNMERSALAGFEDMLLNKVSSLSAEESLVWAHKQAYIALGVLLAAASEVNVDSGPMEGFDPAKFDEILGLKELGLTTSVISAIGYRAEDDEYSKLPKVRKSASDLFIKI
ncbi:NAD(P)H-dependent oxidoreductase [Mucilaginibacter aquatilis]|uniref:NAD(P)H-dependent oxidoreductase n=1 Tax=Mucilaginibacter aquatilis TaxID=1517760 RepID=A0A6I4I8X1_9SPHI|nr:NAD(P)H-dependent oxidoreductase [Mucilaginibacter aquatilis]MVN90438.1 NAD(P)H-dependent oxidoreductase [Mucilaginibacter aquatilis]